MSSLIRVSRILQLALLVIASVYIAWIGRSAGANDLVGLGIAGLLVSGAVARHAFVETGPRSLR